MFDNLFVFILVLVLIFVAFNPSYLVQGEELPTSTEIFSFGYEVTFGTFEVIATLRDGPQAFYDRFIVWKTALIGDYNLIDFLDFVTDRSPTVRIFKKIIRESPDIMDWIHQKIGE